MQLSRQAQISYETWSRKLTPKELEVAHIIERHNNRIPTKEIAFLLNVGLRRIQQIIQSLKEKLKDFMCDEHIVIVKTEESHYSKRYKVICYRSINLDKYLFSAALFAPSYNDIMDVTLNVANDVDICDLRKKVEAPGRGSLSWSLGATLDKCKKFIDRNETDCTIINAIPYININNIISNRDTVSHKLTVSLNIDNNYINKGAANHEHKHDNSFEVDNNRGDIGFRHIPYIPPKRTHLTKSKILTFKESYTYRVMEDMYHKAIKSLLPEETGLFSKALKQLEEYGVINDLGDPLTNNFYYYEFVTTSIARNDFIYFYKIVLHYLFSYLVTYRGCENQRKYVSRIFTPTLVEKLESGLYRNDKKALSEIEIAKHTKDFILKNVSPEGLTSLKLVGYTLSMCAAIINHIN